MRRSVRLRYVVLGLTVATALIPIQCVMSCARGAAGVRTGGCTETCYSIVGVPWPGGSVAIAYIAALAFVAAGVMMLFARMGRK